METTPALDAALAADGVTFFLCGKADLPNYTLRLLDGAGEITWSEGTFKGRDDRYGVLQAIDAISDGIGDQAPQLSISFAPPSETAAADLLHPDHQGSRIRIWIGAIDPVTRAVIANPYLLFDGELDQPTISIDKGERELEYECVSAFERLFRNDEGHRLSDAHHQEVWPGELGLREVTGVIKSVIWGPGDKIPGSWPGAGGSGGGAGGGWTARDAIQSIFGRDY